MKRAPVFDPSDLPIPLACSLIVHSGWPFPFSLQNVRWRYAEAKSTSSPSCVNSEISNSFFLMLSLINQSLPVHPRGSGVLV